MIKATENGRANSAMSEFIRGAICNKHNGKMEGMLSLSTACTCNEFCKKMQANNNAVCSKCYSNKMLNRYRSLRNKLERNYEILTKEEVKPIDVPFVNASFFRFEAFGEIATERQLLNYCTIARKNPHCNFALWTKNNELLQKCFENNEKPQNLQIIYSSPILNKKAIIKDTHNVIDKIFTVFTKEYADNNGIEINCGTRKCCDCLICYKNIQGVFEVNELIK